MPNAALPRSTEPAADAVRLTGSAAFRTTNPVARVADAAAELADAVAEFDAALDQGRPMTALVRLDQQVTAADRLHRATLAASLSG